MWKTASAILPALLTAPETAIPAAAAVPSPTWGAMPKPKARTPTDAAALPVKRIAVPPPDGSAATGTAPAVSIPSTAGTVSGRNFLIPAGFAARTCTAGRTTMTPAATATAKNPRTDLSNVCLRVSKTRLRFCLWQKPAEFFQKNTSQNCKLNAPAPVGAVFLENSKFLDIIFKNHQNNLHFT